MLHVVLIASDNAKQIVCVHVYKVQVSCYLIHETLERLTLFRSLLHRFVFDGKLADDQFLKNNLLVEVHGKVLHVQDCITVRNFFDFSTVGNHHKDTNRHLTWAPSVVDYTTQRLIDAHHPSVACAKTNF